MARRPRNLHVPGRVVRDDRGSEKETDDDILQEAKDRFKRVADWESDFRTNYVTDVKFANGDSDNKWQWPADLFQDREINKRPTLTINKTKQIVLQYTNDARQNKPSISIKAVGNQATYEAAQAWEGLIRNIEYMSNAQVIYDEATESQAEGGIAYWRVVNKYVDDDSFDQELRIEPVRDHLGVYLDCDIKQKDGSDARFGFIFDELPRSEFERQYPDIELPPATATGLDETDQWVTQDNVRIAEYYRILETKDELILISGEGDQEDITFRRSDMPKAARDQLAELEDAGRVKKRPINVKRLQWFKIAGNEIIDRIDDLKCPYIPIARVPGTERIIEGQLERKGIVRPLKDPQRMYNYNSSGQVEYGALQTKSPWVGPKEAFEGNEVAWNNANRQNAAYLTYNHLDSERNPIPPPTRPEPPGASPAFLEGMRVASAEMEMASGRVSMQQPNPALERTPKAIAARERIADTATYHMVDNLNIAIRHTGKIILAWAPYIYDTKRVTQILGKDGTQTELQIDPSAPQAFQEQKDAQDAERAQAILNPKIGKYEVQSDVGPAYQTQRQEAWNAFVTITSSNAELLSQIGDLMFQAADFPMADKIAERLKRAIKQNAPWLLDDNAPTPMVTQLQQQVQAMEGEKSQLLLQLAELKLKLRGREQLRDIQAYDAETKRVTAVSNAQPELDKLGLSGALKGLIMETMREMAGTDITSDINAQQENGEGEGAMPELTPEGGEEPIDPLAQLRRAKDGNHYMPDPERPGKYLQVEIPEAGGPMNG